MPNLYTYSEIKQEYLYLNQKVQDLNTNDIGYIYQLSRTNGTFKTENIIKVQFDIYKKIYVSSNHINLEILNQ